MDRGCARARRHGTVVQPRTPVLHEYHQGFKDHHISVPALH